MARPALLCALASLLCALAAARGAAAAAEQSVLLLKPDLVQRGINSLAAVKRFHKRYVEPEGFQLVGLKEVTLDKVRRAGGGEASLSVGRPRASARALAHTPPKTAQRGRAGWCALLLLAGGGSWVAPALTRRCGGHATRRACVAREEGGVALLAPRPITRAAPCYLGASASACAILWGCGLRPASAIGDGINQMPTPVSRKARLARTSTKCASSPRLACSWSVFGPPFAAARLPARPLTVGYG